MAPIAAQECPSAARDRDCVGELAFGFGSGLERVADSAQCRSVADIDRALFSASALVHCARDLIQVVGAAPVEQHSSE